MLKVGAIGGVFALRFALMRKNRPVEDGAQPEPAEVAPPVEQSPHPVSRKKKRRRRRRRDSAVPEGTTPFWLDAPYEPRGALDGDIEAESA